MVAAEEAMLSLGSPIAFRTLDKPVVFQVPGSLPVHSDATMTPEHRLAPTDILLVRRLRRVTSLLAADHTAHTEIAGLVLS
jgi:hypothetical protein